MIDSVVSSLYVLIILFVSFLYLAKRYKKSNKELLLTTVRNHKKYTAFSLVICILIFAGSVAFSILFGVDKLELLLKWDTLLVGTFVVSITDWKEKKIPNLVIGTMLAVRLCFLIYEAVSNFDYIKQVLIYPLLGAAIGTVIMFVAMLISRKGVGMGDVKLFLTIGAYVGSSMIIPTLFYTFLISAIVGIFLLITRKAKLKDSIPMAPFAFAGVAIEFVLLMIGG